MTHKKKNLQKKTMTRMMSEDYSELWSCIGLQVINVRDYKTETLTVNC